MIDFPASPTDGQIFNAPNGVVYKYSATYTSWLTQNPAPAIGGTGDFYGVYNGADFTLGTTYVTMPIATMMTGNSGLWYGLGTTSRYTPPAGRYKLFAGYGFYGPAVNCVGYIHIRKNGVMIGAEYQIVQPTIGVLLQPVIEGTFDANGSDYFEVFIHTSQATASARTCYFGAFPLTGLQGPTGGPPGSVVGDFMASGSGFTLAPSIAKITALTTVNTGNSGAYYNTATQRYTPPAGRYYISGQIYGIASTASSVGLNLYKNGASYTAQLSTIAQNGYYTEVSVDALVDSNGTDYWELWGSANGSTTSTSGTFKAFPTQGMVGPQGPVGPIGQTQTVFTETGVVATGTTIIPFDDTIPQQTEGDQYMSLAITPLSATSKLIIEVVWNGSASINTTHIIAALFQDAAPNALATMTDYQTTGTGLVNLSFRHVMTSGTTSTTTFKVRAGCQLAGTTTFNGQGGTRSFGGVMASSIVIREVP